MPDRNDSYRDDGHGEDLPLSKSALKREMLALQALGKQLSTLPDSHFARLPLSDEMREAIALYKRLNKNEALRRQLQFIGKQMSRENVEGIRAALHQIENENRMFHQHFHKLEQVRDKLIAEGDGTVAGLVADNPGLDVQQLRNLVRQAQKERSQQKPPAASRKLFRFLRENLKSEV